MRDTVARLDAGGGEAGCRGSALLLDLGRASSTACRRRGAPAAFGAAAHRGYPGPWQRLGRDQVRGLAVEPVRGARRRGRREAGSHQRQPVASVSV